MCMLFNLDEIYTGDCLSLIENMPDNPVNYDKSIKVIILGD